jgi:hypothetical protein
MNPMFGGAVPANAAMDPTGFNFMNAAAANQPGLFQQQFAGLTPDAAATGVQQTGFMGAPQYWGMQFPPGMNMAAPMGGSPFRVSAGAAQQQMGFGSGIPQQGAGGPPQGGQQYPNGGGQRAQGDMQVEEMK